MESNNIEEKIKNLQEWNDERVRIKPILDEAIFEHNSARREANWHNYDKAEYYYTEAIKKYRNVLTENPKYYLQDLLDRIDHVIEEYINNRFNLKASDYKLKNKTTIREFVSFIDTLNDDDSKYLNPYDVARAFQTIGDFYYREGKDIDKAYEFYKRVINLYCGRPFIDRDVHFNMGKILFEQHKYKEALISFISVLSFDRDSEKVKKCIEDCLRKLKILEHRDKFLVATPKQAKKLIMEVL